MTYPGECCGVLIGRPHRNGLEKVFVERILAVQPADGGGDVQGPNPVPAETHAAAAHEARSLGMEVVGYYLARAGGTATPSELELETLAPGMSYLLTAISAGNTCPSLRRLQTSRPARST